MGTKVIKRHNLFQLLTILLAFTLGIVASLIFHEKMQSVTFLADIYMGILQMAVIPFVFFGIIKTFAGKKESLNTKKLLRKFLLYWGTTAVFLAVASTLLSTIIIRGQPDMEAVGTIANANPKLTDVIVNLFPQNILSTLSTNNILAIIILGVIMGMGISGLKIDMQEKIVSGCDLVIDWMRMIIVRLIRLLPVFIFITSSNLFQQMDTGNVWGLVSTFIAVLIGLLIAYLLVYPTALKLSGRSPLAFYKSMLAAHLTAFTSCSSVLAFPITLQAMKEDFSLNDSTINMLSGISLTLKHSDCLQLPIYCIFAAQFYGIPLSIPSLCLIIAISIFAGFGTVGIPGGAIVLVIMTFNILGFPLEVVGIISGIYVLIDMPITMLNVTDDAVGLLISDNDNV